MRTILKRMVERVERPKGGQICPFERRRIVAMIDAGLGYGQIHRELGVGIREIDRALRHAADTAAP